MGKTDLQNNIKLNTKLKKWRIPVTWEMCGEVIIEAEKIEDAIEIVKKDEENISLPTESYYVDGSFRLSDDNMEELKAMIKEV